MTKLIKIIREKYVSTLIIIITITAMLSLPLNGGIGLSVKPGDSLTYLNKTMRQYRDAFNNDFSLELARTIKTLVQDVDQNAVNYDLIIQQHYFSFAFSLENGDWISSKQDGEKTTITRGLQENLTSDQYRQFVYLDGMEFPFYDPQDVGNKYKDWNGSKSNQRFSFFDLIHDEALDEFEFRIEMPFFVSDSAAIMNALESQWRALAFNEVERLPSLRWNVLEEGWEYPFRFKLLKNVAYEAKITERTSSGAPKTVEFTPSWIGHYWLPNDSPQWNGTAWEDRTDWIAGVVNPLDSGTGNLRSDLKYYSSTPLNTKRPSMSDYFDDLRVTFTENELQIHFSVFIEDLDRYTFHDDLEWARQNRNNGTLTIDYHLRLNQAKNTLSLKMEQQHYDFGLLGKFSFTNELEITTEDANRSMLAAAIMGTTAVGLLIVLIITINRRQQLTKND